MTDPRQAVAHALAQNLHWPEMPWQSVRFAETPSALATRLPIADIAMLGQAAIGLSSAALHEARTGVAQTVSVDRRAASLSMAAASYLALDGKPAVEWDPFMGYYRTADGWVYLHTAFAHLREPLLKEYGSPQTRGELERTIASLNAQDIEDRAAEMGVCAIAMRDRASWEAHPHAAALRAQPLIAMDRLGTASPRVLSSGVTPLEGVRVLDLSRVIAGPMIGRTLAEHGADVIRISAPHLPSIQSLVISTGFGKRAAAIDLRTPAGSGTLRTLIRSADVLIDGYRPGALANRGFGLDHLIELNPSLVYLTLSAFGESGPWAGRRGYDTYVQAGTGLCEITEDGPRRLPCQPLDYLTGYLGAAAVMTALRHRMTQGSAWRCELSLARMAQWIWDCSDQLPPDLAAPETNADRASLDDVLVRTPSHWGEISSPPPAVMMSVTPPQKGRVPVPLGSDAPVW